MQDYRALLQDDAVLIGAFEYWRAKRAGRPMPSRADIDPIELGPRILPHVILTEAEEIGGKFRFKFRLSGTALAESLGHSLTGQYVDSLNPNKKYAAYIEGLYLRAMATRRPIFSSSIATLSRSPARRRTRRLMCPLSQDGRTVNMFFSAQTFQALGSGQLPTMTYADGFEPGDVAVIEPD